MEQHHSVRLALLTFTSVFKVKLCINEYIWRPLHMMETLKDWVAYGKTGWKIMAMQLS